MALCNRTTQPLVLGEQKCGVFLPMLLAVGAVLASFLWQGHMGISTADEGFLWYGVQRVLRGEVPIRDFYSYDPGRYYWTALIMFLLNNDGIIALRIANAVTQAMGLFLALLLLDRDGSRGRVPFLTATAITMIFWMFPWFKLFDVSLSIALIGGLSFLIKRPIGRRYFGAGLMVGFIAALCRQQGTFAVLGSLGVIFYLALKRQEGPGFFQGVLIWLGGVTVGYLPAFLMCAFVPGYGAAFWDSIRVLVFELKGSLISIPVPWPWLVPLGRISAGASLRWVLSGLYFMAPIVLGVSGIVWVIFKKLRQRPVSAVFVACAFLALPYAFYVLGAPDISRLGLGLFPFLIGVFTVLMNCKPRAKWLFTEVLLATTLLVMLPNHPGWKSERYVEVDVGGDALKIYPEDAKFFAMVCELVRDYAPNGRTFIAVPRFTTAYAAWRRKSPMHEIYSSYPRSEAFQRSEIERIKSADPGFAIIYDALILGRRFRDTHPLIYRYILDNFEPLPSHGYTDDPTYQLYKRKKGAS